MPKMSDGMKYLGIQKRFRGNLNQSLYQYFRHEIGSLSASHETFYG